jgi:hypothetical protein
MKILVPGTGERCSKVVKTDFDKFKIPAPPGGCESQKDQTVMLFTDSEQAVKYALHLGDVIERMSAKKGYDCSIKKIKVIISAINEQADFSSLEFPE